MLGLGTKIYYFLTYSFGDFPLCTKISLLINQNKAPDKDNFLMQLDVQKSIEPNQKWIGSFVKANPIILSYLNYKYCVKIFGLAPIPRFSASVYLVRDATTSLDLSTCLLTRTK